eukprot:91449-Chlamydomonas_euryale.AAC.1
MHSLLQRARCVAKHSGPAGGIGLLAAKLHAPRHAHSLHVFLPRWRRLVLCSAWEGGPGDRPPLGRWCGTALG